MDALSIGAAGISAATARFTASAERTATGTADLAAEAVDQSEAQTALTASVAVVKTEDAMAKRLLDIRV